MFSEAVLDDLAWRILAELQENARVSYTELGKRVGLTPPAVAERVRRLEEAGVIVGYRAVVDHEKLGLPLMAIIRITIPGEGGCNAFKSVVQRFPEVVEAHRVTGGDSHVLKVVVPSVPHLEGLLNRLGEYGQTTTSIVLSSPVTFRCLEQAHVAAG